MRLVVLKADTVQSLNSKLSKTTPAGTASPLDRLKALNPHVDFARLDPGTVLFLPDTPELDEAGSRTLDGGAFDAFASDLETGFKAAASRVRAGADRLDSDRTDVGAVLKTAALKRLIESDSVLKAQVDDATSQFAKDQRESKDKQKQVETMQKKSAAEMAALGKLFG